MNRKQNNLLTTGHAVASVLATITAASASPALQAARTALDNTLAEIDSYAAQQAEPLTGKTQDRDRMLERSVETTHRIARLVLGHAVANGLADVATQVNMSPSELRRPRLAHRIYRMRQVHTAAMSLSTQIATLVTPAMLEDLEQQINAAQAALPLTRTHIAARRVATVNLQRAFHRVEELLRYTLDPLMELHREIDADAYLRYRAARLIINLPGGPAQNATSTPPVTAPLATQPLAA